MGGTRRPVEIQHMDENQAFYGPTDSELLAGAAASTPAIAAPLTQQTYGLGDVVSAQLASIGTGYLSRRLDVDIAGRLQTLGTVGRTGAQNPINSTPQSGLVVTQNGTVAVNLPRLLPLLMWGALAYLALNR